jgi:microsomal dipeptidase-like Zn-dependent dipeptidase
MLAALAGARDGQAQQVAPGVAPVQPRPGPVPVQPGPAPVGPGVLGGPNDLRGFADLHVHPATHFAFGRNGADEGLFWGKPGMKFEDGQRTVDGDLKPCAGTGDPNVVGSISHGTGADFDMVRHATHQQMVQGLDSSSGFSHSRNGAPGYGSWPSARSLLHEQMHVTMLHRAWEGGLRLIVAAAVDSQLLTRVWNNGFNIGNNGIPRSDPSFDFESAKRQLTFIKQFVAANSTWMEVVKTSDEARRAIQAGKLAVVLGVEMDSLTPDQILDLVRTHDVRSAIPVHLTDNPAFGGSAVYGDLFNTSTQYLTGHFYRVAADPLLSARLSPDTSTLVDPGGLEGFLNAKIPQSLQRADYCRLGYECCPDMPVAGCLPRNFGHKNATGLGTPGQAAVERLMKAGVIVDIVHMGEKSTEEALALAERFNYPVMNSHSGMRDEHKCAENERAMRFDHARRMARLGGMFGLGTEGNTQPTTMLNESGTPIVRFTGDMKQRTWNLRIAKKDVIDQVKYEVHTGGDDLRDARTAFGFLDVANAPRDQFVLNQDSGWGNDSTNTIIHDVDIRPQDLKAVGVHTTFGGGMGGDNWNMNRVVVSVRINGKWTVVANASGNPVVRFTGDRHDWSTNVNVGASGSLNTCTPEASTLSPDAPVARLAVTIKTGGDDIRGGNDNAYGTLTLNDGRKIEFGLNKGVQWPNGAITTVTTTVPEGTRVRDLKTFSIRETFGGGIGGDNWNVDVLIVQAQGDPVPNWVAEYQSAMALMGNRGVAIGTDMNGLAPQFPYTLKRTRYPVDVARKQGVPNARDLGQDRLGSRTFEFSQDGVAHIGLLPDFMGALSEAPNGERVVGGLYRSAGDFVEMWRKIEEASRRIH